MTRYPGSGEHQECPVTRETRRWAVSPLDFCASVARSQRGRAHGALRASAAHRRQQLRSAATGPAVRELPDDLLADFALHAAAGALTDALRTLQIPAGRRL